jgi:hypothetical protein
LARGRWIWPGGEEACCSGVELVEATFGAQTRGFEGAGDVLECGEAPGAFYRPMQRGEWTGSHRVAGEWSFYSFRFKTARRGGDPEGAAKICKVGVGGSAPRDAQGGTVQGGGGRPT